jgi:hypothetical protein
MKAVPTQVRSDDLLYSEACRRRLMEMVYPWYMVYNVSIRSCILRPCAASLSVVDYY